MWQLRKEQQDHRWSNLLANTFDLSGFGNAERDILEAAVKNGEVDRNSLMELAKDKQSTIKHNSNKLMEWIQQNRPSVSEKDSTQASLIASEQLPYYGSYCGGFSSQGGIVTPMEGVEEQQTNADLSKGNTSLVKSDQTFGTTVLPDSSNAIIHDTLSPSASHATSEAASSPTPLEWYEGFQPLLLTLPDDKWIKTTYWMALRNHKKKSTVAAVLIPNGPAFKIPAPVQLNPFNTNPLHSLSSGTIKLLDIKTIEVTDFCFSANGVAAWFMVGKDIGPNSSGHIVPIFDRNSKSFDCESLRDYRNETVTLRLPGTLTIKDVFWLSVYSPPRLLDLSKQYVPYKDINLPPDLQGTAMGLKRNLMSLFFFWNILAGVLCSEAVINGYDPDYGVFVGSLSNLADGEVEGKVYVINETALQIVNFTYNGKAPDLYFWLDKSEAPTKDGLKVPSFESGITPLGKYDNVERVVLILPGLHKIGSFKSLSLYCYTYEHNFGSVVFPEGLVVPKPQFLSSELRGNRYSVGSGPILIADRRTIKVFGFTFDGDKAPDGYFFVGRGPNVAHDAGVKVPIRGRDTAELITAMNERYRGGQDIIVDLPEDYDINHIDWLSIYCYKFRVDFGHVPISNVSQKIPPFVPPQKKFEDMESQVEGWTVRSILGTANRTNFTMQLGPPGGKRGYQAMARARPSKNVWYVNGYLAEIYLKRGVTYTFIIEGGNDPSTFYNPLYISDDPFGGYSMLSNDERQQVKIYAGSDPTKSAGRQCVWSRRNENEDADKYNSFQEFKQSLQLKCVGGADSAGTLVFTPDHDTPDTLYYQSHANYNMGWKIHVVDELPSNIEDSPEEPYNYEELLERQSLKQDTGANGAPCNCLSTALCFAIVYLLAYFQH
ncbi:hypothetical protein QR680_001908 [Steinernema hermaphroditum]|uniref:DM13 domain-containing protein n=1 Tax=Steinernema hermaphroditum TaxID=289476 RepID=A0AA39H0D3_9BILA|nr:hypothetical protein QR680_001908 [Steinernema hermaphroditum]